MKRASFVSKHIILVLLGVLLTGTAVNAAIQPIDLTKKNPASGYLPVCSGESIGIGSVIYEGYLSCMAADSFATWKVPSGYYLFECYCGVGDGWSIDRAEFTFSIDGDTKRSFTVAKNEKAVKVSLSVKPGQSLRIDNDSGAIAEPRFLAQAASTPQTKPGGLKPQSAITSFVVDPKDIESLAQKLREKVDSKPSLKSKVEKASIAISEFELIDIPSKSISKNVAEDLYTAMIDEDFNLIERRKLQEVLGELKVQYSGISDPRTARKIGKLSGCSLILLGSISDRGQVVVVNARLMETETGKSIVAQKVEMRKVSINSTTPLEEME